MAVQMLLVVLTVLSLQTATSFTVHSRHSQLKALLTHDKALLGRNTELWAKQRDADDEDDKEKDEELEELISKEKFYRELMDMKEARKEDGDSKKKPKGKQKAIKKPHDNRDQLPFLVQVMTPPDDIYEQQILQQKKKKKKSKKKRRKGDAADDDDDDDGDIVGETLGEFHFEKNTSSGDRIQIDEQVYLVTKAKCQYRYAGAQKFVMVRKILQVKPVQRAMQEDYIMRQFNAPAARESD